MPLTLAIDIGATGLKAGVLDDDGLECGYNVRNFVTLRMVKLVRDVAIAP